ncbi:sigma-70 family RNA polymerase sigma factor [Acidovorax sp. sic0104]|uniref:sigma-70 family RNA polymerase sigma factor n=1 Tax=Acidovorax sp. sic0104 TaxID=2854784 RepID=UPI0030D87CFF
MDHNDFQARELLVRHYMPLARTLAAVNFKGRFNDDVPFSDYMQLACVGLMESVDRFEPHQAVPFKSYAAHRIRGAILNGLEKETEKNQQIAARKRIRNDRLEAVKANAKESAASPCIEAKPSSQKVQRDLLCYLAEVGIGLALGVLLEDSAMVLDQEPADTSESASPEASYFRKSETARLRELLRAAVSQLPDRERTVIRYHYQQEVAFDEVGRLLNVSRGRISQLHRQALIRLRTALGQGPPVDVSW